MAGRAKWTSTDLPLEERILLAAQRNREKEVEKHAEQIERLREMGAPPRIRFTLPSATQLSVVHSVREEAIEALVRSGKLVRADFGKKELFLTPEDAATIPGGSVSDES